MGQGLFLLLHLLFGMFSSSIKSVENIVKFHHLLKTYLVNLAYPPQLPGTSISLMMTAIVY